VESAEAHGMLYPAYQEKKGNLKMAKGIYDRAAITTRPKWS
jgi:hypothetical protein